MKNIILACGLLGILGAFSVGCGGNKCDEYADKFIAKYESCGLKVEQGSGSAEASCSDAQAKQAECLIPCVDQLACECIDPEKVAAGECTEDKGKAANECIAACAG